MVVARRRRQSRGRTRLTGNGSPLTSAIRIPGPRIAQAAPTRQLRRSAPLTTTFGTVRPPVRSATSTRTHARARALLERNREPDEDGPGPRAIQTADKGGHHDVRWRIAHDDHVLACHAAASTRTPFQNATRFSISAAAGFGDG